MEQAAQNKNSVADQRKKIKNKGIITAAVKLWCVRDMVKYNAAVEIKDGVRWICGMMETAAAEA